MGVYRPSTTDSGLIDGEGAPGYGWGFFLFLLRDKTYPQSYPHRQICDVDNLSNSCPFVTEVRSHLFFYINGLYLAHNLNGEQNEVTHARQYENCEG